MAIESLPSLSVMTTGRFTTASKSRIATWGRLMIGVAMIEPYCPGLVIVKVAPCTSSGESCRARSRELAPDEVRGGTFTITNPGQYGSIMATPIINQPQVAILDFEAVIKRPVVVTDADGNDSIAIRPMTILGLSWDHRALDGAIAAQFLASVKRHLENRNEI